MFTGFGVVILGKITPHGKHPSSESPAAVPLTATIFFLRGSMTRTFLSLQAVQSRLPLRLQLTLKITSGCMSSRLIMASPVPTFQMTIWLSHPKMDTQQHSLTTRTSAVYFKHFMSHKATRQRATPEIIGQIWSSAVHRGQMAKTIA